MQITKKNGFIFLLILWACLYIPGLGIKEIGRNEARRIFPAQNMIITGDYVVPVLGGEPYFRKPPMINWIISAAFKLTGKETAVTARVPTTLIILGFTLFLFLFPGSLLNISERFIGAVVFLTTFGILNLGRTANIDPNYVCFTGFALISWIFLYYDNKQGFSLWLLPALFLSIGMLLKGPLILFIFYIPVLTICLNQKQLKVIFSLPHLCAIVIMFLGFGIWYYLAARTGIKVYSEASGQVMADTWYQEIVHRFHFGEISFSKWLSRVGGGVGQFLPWLVALCLWFIPEIKKQFEQKKSILIKSSLIAILITFVGINAMPVTKSRYSLPILPLLSMITGMLIYRIPLKRIPEKIKKNIFVGIFGTALIIGLLEIILFILFETGILHDIIVHIKHVNHNVVNVSAVYKVVIIIVSGMILFYMWRMYHKQPITIECLILSFAYMFSLGTMFFFVFIFPWVRHTYASSFADVINKTVPHDKLIYITPFSAKEPGIFYVKRKISLISLRNNKKLPLHANFFLIPAGSKKCFKKVSEKYIIEKEQKVNYHDHRYILIKVREKL